MGRCSHDQRLGIAPSYSDCLASLAAFSSARQLNSASGRRQQLVLSPCRRTPRGCTGKVITAVRVSKFRFSLEASEVNLHSTIQDCVFAPASGSQVTAVPTRLTGLDLGLHFTTIFPYQYFVLPAPRVLFCRKRKWRRRHTADEKPLDVTMWCRLTYLRPRY